MEKISFNKYKGGIEGNIYFIEKILKGNDKFLLKSLLDVEELDAETRSDFEVELENYNIKMESMNKSDFPKDAMEYFLTGVSSFTGLPEYTTRNNHDWAIFNAIASPLDLFIKINVPDYVSKLDESITKKVTKPIINFLNSLFD